MLVGGKSRDAPVDTKAPGKLKHQQWNPISHSSGGVSRQTRCGQRLEQRIVSVYLSIAYLLGILAACMAGTIESSAKSGLAR